MIPIKTSMIDQIFDSSLVNDLENDESFLNEEEKE